MDELVTSKHNFDKLKNELKEFSEKEDAEFALDEVDTDGWFFGLNDHKVTGTELNRRIGTIQDHFIAVNQTNNKLIKEFRVVYDTFEALDKDYINSIVATVKALEKTSNDVQEQQKELDDHQNKLDAHQTEIEKTISGLENVVTVLKAFKEELDKSEHLNNIDDIWDATQTLQEDLKEKEERLNDIIRTIGGAAQALREGLDEHKTAYAAKMELIDSRFDDLENYNIQNDEQLYEHAQSIGQIENNIERMRASIWQMDADHLKKTDSLKTRISALEDYEIKLRKLRHLQDIDGVWKKAERLDEDYTKLEKEVDVHSQKLDNVKKEIGMFYGEYSENIENLNQYTAELKDIRHLQDIDAEWDQVQYQGEALANVDSKLTVLTEKQETDVSELNAKLRRAWFSLGGTVFLLLIEIVVNILGMLGIIG